MSQLKYKLVSDEDSKQITVYHDGETYTASDSHPYWDAIFDMVLEDDTAALELFNPSKGIRSRLSDRVSIDDWGNVYFDQDKVDGAVANHLGRLYQEGVSLTPWVNLYEKIMQNPNEGSRKMLYKFLEHFNFTIANDGDIIAYKSVVALGDGYVSSHSGPAIVDGESHSSGRVPNNIGSVIEMARSEVTYDPNNACAHGLHVASWDYVKSSGTILMVRVNPRDVVSVPHHEDAKVRVCRYQVISQVTEPLQVALWSDSGYVDDEYVDFESEAKTQVEPSNEEVQSTTKEKSQVSTTTRYRYPSQAKWDDIVATAKRRKKGLVTFVTQMTTWEQIPGRDSKDRKGWSV